MTPSARKISTARRPRGFHVRFPKGTLSFPRASRPLSRAIERASSTAGGGKHVRWLPKRCIYRRNAFECARKVCAFSFASAGGGDATFFFGPRLLLIYC